MGTFAYQGPLGDIYTLFGEYIMCLFCWKFWASGFDSSR